MQFAALWMQDSVLFTDDTEGPYNPPDTTQRLIEYGQSALLNKEGTGFLDFRAELELE